MIRATTRAIARRTSWLAVAFLGALFFAALPACASTQVFDHTYPLQPGGIFHWQT